ncbi:DUF7305 domain-containing protein [Proteiniclasticum ruminis]|uniref:PilX N-terminal n=1 Tax=Proteiniclasticum ruminis TaxID=398199 RepID=A0A1G8KLC7_9CLOT|nr:PilX N-terminal domain-containing pilus assembly protein [Proteiniclasticum ruminis]SDI44237.1 hypothetical protein SAMN05421804_102358 [Proteiniclasticum ruminis]
MIEVNPIRKNEGSALVFVLILLLVMSILGVSVLSLSVSENKQAVHQETKIKYYYSARAGADAMAAYLIKNPSMLSKVIEQSKKGPAIGSIDGKGFEVYVTGTEHEFIIESISYGVDGFEESKLYLTMKENNILDHAIFTKDTIDLKKTHINGNIGTNSAAMNLGSSLINGNITLGIGASTVDIHSAEGYVSSGYVVNKLSEPIYLPDPNSDDFPTPINTGTIRINTNDYVDDLVDGKLYAKIDSIDIGGNTEFLVEGGGQVHLFVTGLIETKGTSSIITDDYTDLYIYSDTNQKISIRGASSQSNVVVYAPNAIIEFNGGGNGNIKASFIAREFWGPSSNYTITQSTGSMVDLNLSQSVGYYRATWSE